MSNNKFSMKKLAIAGILAAFVFIGTELHVPTGIGYVNLGDAIILLSSMILGPFAFFPAAIGSALGDLIAGYPMYIAPTFIIKGCMGLVAGLIMSKKTSFPFKLLSGVIAEIIMIGGYFAFEALPFMYGVEAALGSVVPNMIQAAAALIIFLPLSFVKVFDKLKS